MGADAVHLVVDAVAALVEVAFDLQRGKLVRHDADAPAFLVGSGAAFAVGENLMRRVRLRCLRRTDRSCRCRQRLGLRRDGSLGAIGGDDDPAADNRIFAQFRHGKSSQVRSKPVQRVIHDRPVPCKRVKPPRQALACAPCSLFILCCRHPARRDSPPAPAGWAGQPLNIPHDALEIGRGPRQGQGSLARGPVQSLAAASTSTVNRTPRPTATPRASKGIASSTTMSAAPSNPSGRGRRGHAAIPRPCRAVRVCASTARPLRVRQIPGAGSPQRPGRFERARRNPPGPAGMKVRSRSGYRAAVPVGRPRWTAQVKWPAPTHSKNAMRPLI